MDHIAIAKQISDRLSLRRPQNESLDILVNVLQKIKLSKDPDLAHTLKIIKDMYPSVQDFKRDFPSICFALATGVGKTRLMGTFISYLYLTENSHNFFVLAPNLTIYDKLKPDFVPQSPKYVFRGIAELVSNPPVIITGEDYDNGKSVRDLSRLFEDANTLFVNIFNISKINATENKKGAEKSKTPRIKRLQETIGESYFEYLSNLPDLVMLMDEAHHYRATAGENAINELKPVLGIELTATPKTTGSKPVDFKNTIYTYSLSEAMKDGHVKEPAVATQVDFKPENYTSERLERIKLEDGICSHEYVKRKLKEYAERYSKKVVKPFMLVVAQNTEHADQLRSLLESETFSGGCYKGKIAEIHSNQLGAEKDENIEKLISVEDPNNSIEIVIHVNKLKEGWDVANLYTIVPLRASASEILTEQTIGRGLRLPYGKKTGVEDIDRLTIIAHDRFQDIVNRANDPDSIIKQTIKIGNGGDIPFEMSQVIAVPSIAEVALTGSSVSGNNYDYQVDRQVIIKTPQDQKIAQMMMEKTRDYGSLKSSSELSTPKIQAQIAKKILDDMKSGQGSLELEPDTTNEDIKGVVGTVTENLGKLMIDIPKIVLIPSSDVKYGFHDFDLDGLEEINYQPSSEEILIRELRNNKSSFLSRDDDEYDKEKKPEKYIIDNLIKHDLVDYDEHADLLYKLVGQMVNRFKSYLSDEKDVIKVLIHNQKEITSFIIEQLKAHYWETPTKYQIHVSQNFMIPESFNCTIQKGTAPRDFRLIPKVKSDVKKIVFGGFSKCCYPFQKFDSVDGELRFAQILEEDETVILWMKPAPGHFRIEYKNGISYEPDFIVETKDAKYLCEPKMASEMESNTVSAKKEAAVEWCDYASDYAKEHGGKLWHYALIPHNAITSNKSFDGLMSHFKVCKHTDLGI